MANAIHKIDWRRGSGSVIVGMAMMFTCFMLCLILMDHGNLFGSTTRAQMAVDSVADGATVWAQTPLRVDTDKLEEMTDLIAAANMRQGIAYTYQTPVVSDDYSRDNYRDQLVTVTMDAATPRIYIPGLTESRTLSTQVGSQVRARTRVPLNVPLSVDDEAAIQYALDHLPRTSPQYNAILKGISMLGWVYSQEYRWVDGYRDCSSFVIDCFRVTGSNYGVSGYTQTVSDVAKANGWYTDWYVGSSSAAELSPGDVLFWRAEWAADIGRPQGLGHTGIYLGQGRILHASPNGGVCVGSVYGLNGGVERLLGYARTPY